MRLYVAAALAWAGYARELSCEISRATGCGIVSSWHDRALCTGTTDPLDADARLRILDANTAELDDADAVVALCHVGAPRATFGEIAYALARGIPVVWTHATDGVGRNIWDAHRLVQRVRVPGEADLVPTIARLLRNLGAEGEPA